MPGENIYDWSVTAANNDTADSLINWREGMARAAVNDSSRSMMAAIAKNRDLLNGSKVTGGTVNAQTFTSGYSFNSIPTIPAGVRVLLQIGPNLTNTGAATLNMDNLGAIPIKTETGTDIPPGVLIGNGYAEFRYDGTSWILLNRGGGGGGGGGRLAFVSATVLSYLPFNGGTIKIGGFLFDIPVAGIAGLANTAVFVNGVAAQNLAANTVYYVYAFNNGGAVTADFSTTGHATSSTLATLGPRSKAGTIAAR